MNIAREREKLMQVTGCVYVEKIYTLPQTFLVNHIHIIKVDGCNIELSWLPQEYHCNRYLLYEFKSIYWKVNWICLMPFLLFICCLNLFKSYYYLLKLSFILN